VNTSTTEFRRVEAGQGVAWISEAWTLFKQAPAIWVILLVLCLLATVVVSMVPVLGDLVMSLAFPIIIGGLLLAAHRQQQGQPVKIEALWSCFSAPHLTPLLVLGLIYLAAGVVLGLIGGLLLATGLVGIMAGGGDLSGASFGFGSICLLSLATWFAPALIVFAGKAPLDAIKLSFAAGLANLGALAIYGLISLMIVMVAMIPFGLGLLIAVPLLTLSAYTSYRDVFGMPVVPATATTAE
jgi:hypothetical protein